MPSNTRGMQRYACAPNEFLSKEDPISKTRHGPPADRPWVADMWLKYVIPFRTMIDFMLPMYITPLYWDIISTYGPIHIFTKLWSDEEHAIYNKDVPGVVVSLFCTTVLFNFMEALIFFFYRDKVSQNWYAVFIHHSILVSAYFGLLYVGQYLIILQAAVGFHHVAFWPVGTFRDWKSTFNFPQKVCLGVWVAVTYTYNHYIHLAVFYHAYGPEQAGALIFWPLRYAITFMSIYQFYYDYKVCQSVWRGFTDNANKK